MAFITTVQQEIPPAAHVYMIPEHTPRSQRERANLIRLSRQTHEGSFSSEQASEKARYTLTNYSKSDLSASLKYFAQKTLKLDPHRFELLPPEEIGYSRDRVYIVWSKKENKPFGVLKIFKDDSQNFFPEVFSLDFLKEAQIPTFASPHIEALGKCKHEDSNYFLLYETAAPGCSFMSHYKNSLPIESLEKGMHACGYSLAKLHQHTTGKIKKIPEDFEKRTREYLEKAIENLTEFPQTGMDVIKLRELFELSIKKIQSEDIPKMVQKSALGCVKAPGLRFPQVGPMFAIWTHLRELNRGSFHSAQSRFLNHFRYIPTAVIHGDTKFENVFYDPQTDTITWIDPPKLSESIHASGSPIGIPAKDFNSFIGDIALKQVMFYLDEQAQVRSIKLISDDAIPQLLVAFCKGYEDGGAKLPSKEQLDFFSLAGHLYFIATDRTRDPTCSVPEPLKSTKKYRMARIFEDLESMLIAFPTKDKSAN